MAFRSMSNHQHREITTTTPVRTGTRQSGGAGAREREVDAGGAAGRWRLAAATIASDDRGLDYFASYSRLESERDNWVSICVLVCTV